MVDTLTVSGIIELEVQEYHDSITEDLVEIYQVDTQNEITGPQQVYPYETYEYNIEDTSGEFSVNDSSKVRLISQEDGQCEIEILSSKKGSFNLIYTTNENTYVLPVMILSL